MLLLLVPIAVYAMETVAIPPSNYSDVNSGTAENPYLISDLPNLRWLSETRSVWGSDTQRFYFKQTANIDATETRNWNNGQGFSPIGDGLFPITFRLRNTDSDVVVNYFIGDFDGNNFTIRNLFMNRNLNSGVDQRTALPAGLFGVIKDSNISNVRLDNVNITSHGITGPLVGLSKNSTILHSSATGKIKERYSLDEIGGLIGYAIENTHIEFCYSRAQIKKGKKNERGRYTGGLIAIMRDSTLRNSYYNGKITRITFNVGGLVGFAQSSTMEHCYVVMRRVNPAPFLERVLTMFLRVNAVHNGLVARAVDSTLMYCLYDIGSGIIRPFHEMENVTYIFRGIMIGPAKKSGVFYPNEFDFENVWKNERRVNNGFPHLKKLK
jgi:hypothetical protein